MSDIEENTMEIVKESATRRLNRISRVKTKYVLPTDRVSVLNQLRILRAVAAIYRVEGQPASNDELSKVLEIHSGSISVCNPFFLDIGLLTRQKSGTVPSEEVLAYADRYKWESEKAAVKLAPIIRKTWFATTLLPKLSFRSLTLHDAISYLADEAGAPPNYRDQLAALIMYMRLVGIVDMQGENIVLIEGEERDAPPSPSTTSNDSESNKQPEVSEKTKGSEYARKDLHPFIEGLLSKLPEPESEWPIAARVKWLQTAANIFGLMYKTKDDDDVEAIDISRGKL